MTTVRSKMTAEPTTPAEALADLCEGLFPPTEFVSDMSAVARQDLPDPYRELLDPLTCPVVLIEPFLLPVKDGQEEWREDLDPKLEVVRKLAVEYGAILVPADTELNRQAAAVGAATLAGDGVHPSPAGHRAIADLWRRVVLEH